MTAIGTTPRFFVLKLFKELSWLDVHGLLPANNCCVTTSPFERRPPAASLGSSSGISGHDSTLRKISLLLVSFNYG